MCYLHQPPPPCSYRVSKKTNQRRSTFEISLCEGRSGNVNERLCKIHRTPSMARFWIRKRYHGSSQINIKFRTYIGRCFVCITILKTDRTRYKYERCRSQIAFSGNMTYSSISKYPQIARYGTETSHTHTQRQCSEDSPSLK